MQDISRAAAAINILDDYLKGYPLEKVLKQWFKKNRFAGSNDRRNIRDLVFDILRKDFDVQVDYTINNNARTGDHIWYITSNDKLRQKFDWVPRISISEIIEDIVRY